jgi:hypothetical protein
VATSSGAYFLPRNLIRSATPSASTTSKLTALASSDISAKRRRMNRFAE